MQEVVTVHFENEMDLILAGRRTMRLAELCGLSLTTQTSLATAVSEIARCALSISKHSSLILGIRILSPDKKQVSAVVCNTTEACVNTEAFNFAKRLITEIRVIKGKDSSCDIQLNQHLKFSRLITETKIGSFIEYFKTEPPLSPYDEIRRKNIQLLEFSDKLKESENQYSKLAETLPLMMFVANPEGRVIYTNQWLKNYLGNSFTVILPFSGKELAHPDDYSVVSKEWSSAFKSGNSFRTQSRLKNKKSGAYLWHLISILPVKSENGTVVQWTGFFVDIHAQKIVEETLKDNAELKEAQKNLVDYQKLLEEKINELNVSNSELEQFAYIASHDLQEPLRKIATFSTLLSDKLPDLDAESRRYFGKIISSSDQMTDQIKGVLDWSRVAKTKEELSDVNLNAVIETVKADLEFPIQQKKAEIQISPLPVVKGIPLQMVQLFSNLISNALKFSDAAPVIKVSSRNLSQSEIDLHNKLDTSISYIEITVSDNGIGFEQEYAEQIFRIFQRLHGHSEYHGTGIGLAICRKIADNHKGEISASGEPGQGATFRIILPGQVKSS